MLVHASRVDEERRPVRDENTSVSMIQRLRLIEEQWRDFAKFEMASVEIAALHLDGFLALGFGGIRGAWFTRRWLWTRSLRSTCTERPAAAQYNWAGTKGGSAPGCQTAGNGLPARGSLGFGQQLWLVVFQINDPAPSLSLQGLHKRSTQVQSIGHQ